MNSERERESHTKTVNGNTRGGRGLAGDEKVLSLSSSSCFLFFKKLKWSQRRRRGTVLQVLEVTCSSRDSAYMNYSKARVTMPRPVIINPPSSKS